MNELRASVLSCFTIHLFACTLHSVNVTPRKARGPNKALLPSPLPRMESPQVLGTWALAAAALSHDPRLRGW
eukprot:scaffold293535_cov31-Tisochrysis_lutea.AAC.3